MMKPTLKSKTEELLKQKENELVELEKELEKLSKKLILERNLSKELFTISKIKIEKEISGLIGARSKTKLFTTDLKVLLNWAE